jgi:dienelactone hydrolase
MARNGIRNLGVLLFVSGLLATALARSVLANPGLTAEWPDPASTPPAVEEDVTLASSSPYLLTDVDKKRAPATTIHGTLFLPPGPHDPHSLPAVVMLHGSSGVLAARELTYGKQLASMGIDVLVVDSFGARRDRGSSFTERLLNITETMLVADGYAALGDLAARPEIDPKRIVLVGFSYGAMATTYALMAEVADRMAPSGLRFAGHVSFYGPCVARFDDRRTTGAPLLMLYGSDDQIVDNARCAAVADDLRAGGSKVDVIVYPGAVHQWDGPFGRRLIGRNVAACDFEVRRDGSIHDRSSGFVMANPTMREMLLGLCVTDKPYPIGRDDSVRQKSNRDFGRFLAHVFQLPPE